MNAFKALFSGDRIYKEEFASSFFASIISPQIDHGLKLKPLELLLNNLTSKYTENQILQDCFNYVSNDLKTRNIPETNNIRTSTLTPHCNTILTHLEEEHVDISIRIGNFLLLIENKIYECSIGDVKKEICGYYNAIKKKQIPNLKIIPLIIYPSSSNIPKEKIFTDKNETEICTLSWDKDIKEILEELNKNTNNSPQSQTSTTIKMFLDFFNDKYQTYRSSPDDIIISLEKYFDKLSFDKRNKTKLTALLGDFGGSIDNKHVYHNGPILSYQNKSTGKMCFPFKIQNNGFIQINYPGLKPEPFLANKKLEVNGKKLSILDMLQKIMESKGFKFEPTGHKFSLDQIFDSTLEKNFKEINEWLKDKVSSREDICEEYQAVLSTVEKIKVKIDDQYESYGLTDDKLDVKIFLSKENRDKFIKILQDCDK